MFFSPAAQPPQNPCQPSPCGPNSQCREINGHAVCSCLTGFVGSPPTCRPECMVSSDCAQDRACVKQKCIDPCPGTCGVNARCQVVNHNPICSCPPGFTGDPFARCIQQESKHFFSFLFYFIFFQPEFFFKLNFIAAFYVCFFSKCLNIFLNFLFCL